MSSMGFGRVIIADVYQAIMFDNSMDAKDMKDLWRQQVFPGTGRMDGEERRRS